ncbi:hypothetical protein T459_09114 [Capsicum annuum]|uniref:Copia protein n=1 Tax=Capsicum annuum TaxID=4072 RepID=A0A2G2ZYG1_CAPAN|nr:hypothetical protein T459_09114 [Capsicum annuum]
MEDCKSTATPMNPNEKFCKEDGVEKVNEGLYKSLIGCLIYSTATRSDIIYDKAEYISAALAMNQALWIRKLLADLYMEQKKSTEVLVENESIISIVNNTVSHGSTKYFKIKLYFLREVEKSRDINMVHYRTNFQNADILSKYLPGARFEFLREKLGVTALESRRSVNTSASKAGD